MTTPLQQAMLIKIAESEYTALNGAPPTKAEDADTWADCVIESAEDKGTFTSMLNAGLVLHYGKGRDAFVGLTEAGFNAYLKLKENN
jgi:hypothetical protein